MSESEELKKYQAMHLRCLNDRHDLETQLIRLEKSVRYLMDWNPSLQIPNDTHKGILMDAVENSVSRDKTTPTINVKNLPDRIFLCLSDSSFNEPVDFHELREVTWSVDPALNLSVEYIRRNF